MVTRACERCGGELPLLARRDARYCSGRCRTAACRARRAVPAELARCDRWVRHDARKAPLTPSGKPAASTRPRTWSSRRAVRASQAGVGEGFVLAGDGIACIDLDGAIDADGRLTGWAERIVAAAGATWIEVSPSGRGLHVWGRGNVGHGRRIKLPDGGGIEVYDRGRYITVTGRRWPGSPARLGGIQHLIEELVQR
ncbi:DNA primase [Kitasatospora sp. NPDC092948]|uniref:DNA primase n=1 Tax=Kitasatospora sp. NPDC092948 TaxID=3364088 RepID=UPI003816F5F9